MSQTNNETLPTLPAKPRLNRLFRMQWEPAQNAHVLLYPEGMVKLNGSAAAILECCNGERSVDEIVSALEAKFEATGLHDDVVAWLVTATQRNWVI